MYSSRGFRIANGFGYDCSTLNTSQFITEGLCALSMLSKDNFELLVNTKFPCVDIH